MSAELTTTTRPSDPLAIIAQAIEAGKTDAATIEKLVALVERVEDRRAALRFGDAIAAFQAECPPIPRNSSFTVKGSAIAYASFDDVMRLVGPVMARHGISATWSIDHWEPEGNRISGVCRVQVGAHAVDHKFAGVPIPQMTLSGTQAYGAAMSYFRRYSLEASLGIARAGQDDESLLMEPLLAEQVTELRTMLKERGKDEAAFLRFANVEAFDQIPRSDFDKVKWAITHLSKKGGAA